MYPWVSSLKVDEIPTSWFVPRQKSAILDTVTELILFAGNATKKAVPPAPKSKAAPKARSNASAWGSRWTEGRARWKGEPCCGDSCEVEWNEMMLKMTVLFDFHLDERNIFCFRHSSYSFSTFSTLCCWFSGLSVSEVRLFFSSESLRFRGVWICFNLTKPATKVGSFQQLGVEPFGHDQAGVFCAALDWLKHWNFWVFQCLDFEFRRKSLWNPVYFESRKYYRFVIILCGSSFPQSMFHWYFRFKRVWPSIVALAVATWAERFAMFFGGFVTSSRSSFT